MKTYTVSKISVIQAAKVLGVLYSLLAAVLLPIFLISAREDSNMLKAYIIMLLLYPVLGFIGGMAGAFLYNLSSRLVGGFEFSIEVSSEDSP